MAYLKRRRAQADRNASTSVQLGCNEASVALFNTAIAFSDGAVNTDSVLTRSTGLADLAGKHGRRTLQTSARAPARVRGSAAAALFARRRADARPVSRPLVYPLQRHRMPVARSRAPTTGWMSLVQHPRSTVAVSGAGGALVGNLSGRIRLRHQRRDGTEMVVRQGPSGLFTDGLRERWRRRTWNWTPDVVRTADPTHHDPRVEQGRSESWRLLTTHVARHCPYLPVPVSHWRSSRVNGSGSLHSDVHHAGGSERPISCAVGHHCP